MILGLGPSRTGNTKLLHLSLVATHRSSFHTFENQRERKRERQRMALKISDLRFWRFHKRSRIEVFEVVKLPSFHSRRVNSNFPQREKSQEQLCSRSSSNKCKIRRANRCLRENSASLVSYNVVEQVRFRSDLAD